MERRPLREMDFNPQARNDEVVGIRDLLQHMIVPDAADVLPLRRPVRLDDRAPDPNQEHRHRVPNR